MGCDILHLYLIVSFFGLSVSEKACLGLTDCPSHSVQLI